MYYAAPRNESNEGGFMVYIKKKTIAELGKHFARSYADKPNQEFIVYRGDPSNFKNYHAHYYFKNGNWIKKPELLAQLLGEVFCK